MIEPLAGLPAGVLGFRFSGPVSREEYVDVLLPELKDRLEHGEPIRVAFLLADDFGWFRPGALWEDLKFSTGSGVPHHDAWERMAIVSDADWVRHALAAFGWLVPGEVRAFLTPQLDEATAWLAA